LTKGADPVSVGLVDRGAKVAATMGGCQGQSSCFHWEDSREQNRIPEDKRIRSRRCRLDGACGAGLGG